MTEPVFFSPIRRLDLNAIAELTGARLVDSAAGSVEIEDVASASSAGRGQIAFLDGKQAPQLAPAVRASAVFCAEPIAAMLPPGTAALITKYPHQAFALLARTLHPDAVMPGPVLGIRGISPDARIAGDARVEDGATIEAGAIIGPLAVIGANTVIGANAVIGRSCQIGRNGYVGPGASIMHAMIGDRVIIHPGARIGGDGFGFVPGRGGLEKMPQLGRVIIQDDVEIGANAAIDRGALDDTVIGAGTKIDNLVQIAHNVSVGRSCAIAAMTGISGSVRIGDFVMIGGHVGIADHIRIGDGVHLAGGSGVMEDIPAGSRWGGTPAQPIKSWLREVLQLRGMTAARSGKKGNDV